MPEEGFELTITASELTKTVHALDRSATVAGRLGIWSVKLAILSLSYRLFS
jgi:hypothetical protein